MIAAVALVAVTALPLAAAATPAEPTPSPVPFSLTVSPARLVIPADQTTRPHSFNVANTGLQPLHVVVAMAEFSQAPDGKLTFRPPGPVSAAAWVQATPASFDLSPGERQSVSVKVSVPADPEPGEHQVGLTFVVPAQQAGTNITLNRGIGVPLLIQVPGIVVRRIEFGSLTGPWLAVGGPVSMRLAVHNRGNVHRDYIEPDNLVASTSSGDTISFPSFTVLRESGRVIESRWTRPPLFCICRITVRSDDGEGHVIIASARVIVFPLWQVLGALLAAIGLYLLSSSHRRRHRRRVAAALAGLRSQSESWRKRLGADEGTPSEPLVSQAKRQQ